MKTRYFLVALGLLAPIAHAQDLSKQFPVKGDGKSSAKSAGKPKKKGPAQSALALKSAYPSVSESSLKGALTATDLKAAAKSVGKVVTVVGTVDKVFAPGSNSIVLINFARDYRSAVVGAVKSSDFNKFPNLSALKGKKVAISGKMISFKGRPEVELNRTGAIRIVK